MIFVDQILLRKQYRRQLCHNYDVILVKLQLSLNAIQLLLLLLLKKLFNTSAASVALI